MIGDVERDFQDLSAAKEFGTYKWNVESVKLDQRFSAQLLTDIVTTQRNATEALRSLFAQYMRPRASAKAEPEGVSEVIWEKIKARSEEFTEVLSYEGRDFKRVDVLDIFDEASEKKHKFAIMEDRDRYRSRQKLKFPDGVVVEDVGVHFEGGYCSFDAVSYTHLTLPTIYSV